MEAYSWNEGQIYFYTGTATASAVVAFARNHQLLIQRGWEAHQTVSGVYGEHLTGQRADLTCQAVYTYDSTLMKLHESATAIHAHLKHSAINGTAGYFLYSGRIDNLSFNGSEAQPYVFTLTYHSYVFSAYGG